LAHSWQKTKIADIIIPEKNRKNTKPFSTKDATLIR